MIEDIRTAKPQALVAEFVSEPIVRETLARYAQASGDLNPLHLDPAFARQAGFPDVIVHGMLGMALLGRLLSEHFPTNALRAFSARFSAVIPVGSTLRCRARLLGRTQAAASLALEALIGDSDTVAIAGTATIALQEEV